MKPSIQNNPLIVRQGKLAARYVRGTVYPFSPYYRRLMDEKGISPDSIRTGDDFSRLPFTFKKDLVRAAESDVHKLDFLLKPIPAELKHHPALLLRAALRGRGRIKHALEEEFRPVTLTATTGRSSAPVSFLFSQHDMRRLRDAGRMLAEVFQGTREDRVLNMFPFAPHLAFWLTYEALMEVGIFCLNSGGGKVFGTEGNIRMISRIKPTVLIGMPTFIYHVLHQAVEENVRCDSIRVIVLGGEKVPDGTRVKLKDLCGALGSNNVSVIATYGFTEAKMAWGECIYPHDQEPSGYHIDPRTTYIEIVDPKTGVLLPPGTPGEIVYSPIDARGSVVLRYRTGDLISEGLFYEPCPHCGRRVLQLRGKISRQSELREMNLNKIKGTLIDFNQLEHVLDDIEDIQSWALELRKVDDDPLELDELIVHLSAPPGCDRTTIAHRIREQVLAASEISPNEIKFHSPSEIRDLQGVGSQLKERKIIDNRPKAVPRVQEGVRS